MQKSLVFGPELVLLKEERMNAIVRKGSDEMSGVVWAFAFGLSRLGSRDIAPCGMILKRISGHSTCDHFEYRKT